MSARDDNGVTSIPPVVTRPAPQSSYAPVDDAEFEDDIVLEDDVDDDAPELEIAQLRDSEVELRDSAVELRDSAVELSEEALEDDLADDDVISEDALDIPAPARHPYDSEELPTQPHIDSHRFPLSLLGPSAPSGPSASPAPEEDPHVADVLLGEVRGLEDVPPEGQAILAREARIERLGPDEEISSFGLALVLKGVIKVMPAIADLACARAVKGDIVWSEGNLEDGVALRLVAGEEATEVAVWEAELLKGIVRDYPWVVEDLKNLADRFQALAGVAMGPMGERLDDSLRAMVTERCEIRRLLPNEMLTTKGKPVGGMYIMAAGRLEIMAGDEIESELGPGDFLFGPQVLSNGAAPSDARAGKGGALVLFASRSIAHDLLLSVPPLLEIFAS
ncbi:MAG TPA: cyclic nucleotide-binding domain-containing protein [Polyangiaceae bacterium]